MVNIEDLTIGEAKKLATIFGSGAQALAQCPCDGVQIVVLQRGWVVVGRFSQASQECKLTDGFVIRNWGTSKGLGELAESGPLSGTKLDPIPESRFHELTIVMRMKCSDKWEATCKGR